MEVGGCADEEDYDEKERLEVEERGLRCEGAKRMLVSARPALRNGSATYHGCSRLL